MGEMNIPTLTGDHSETLECKLADGFEHAVARRRSGVVDPDQTLVDQRREPIQDTKVTIGARHRLRRSERPTAHKDPESPKEALLLWREQVVAPGDGVAQRALASRRIPWAAREQRQPWFQQLQERVGWQDLDARGRELDRQG